MINDRLKHVAAPLLGFSLLLVPGTRAQDFYQSILADDFESGDLSKWARVRGAKQIAVIPEAGEPAGTYYLDDCQSFRTLAPLGPGR